VRRALLALACLGGCGGDDPAPAASAAPLFPRANVLIVTIDTVRVDRLGCYGYVRPTTPNLDKLAQGGVRFEQAFANSSFTPPTHGSILTGLYPAEHGLLFWNKSLADVPTAADAFKAAGYRTLAVTPLKTLLVVGLSRGFQMAESPEWGTRRGDQVVIANADEVNGAALGFLARKEQQPWFAWLHYYDAHRPYGRQGPEWSGRFVQPDEPVVGATEHWYQLTPEKRERFHVDAAKAAIMEDHYDGGLAYLDDRLGRLFSELREAGALDNTIVLVVADHGEVFTEHEPEWFAHDPYLYDENVHIPLLLSLPGGAHAGLVVPDLVSQVDLLPTLLELTGVAPLEGQRFSGSSLVAALQGRSLQRSFVFADRQGDDLSLPRDGQPTPTDEQVRESRDRLHMLRTLQRKLLLSVDGDRVELLDVAVGGAREQQDLADAEPQALKDAVGAYGRWWQALHAVENTEGVLSAEMEEHLRSLGYIK
jgi:arylsulfatase A-like enzyme